MSILLRIVEKRRERIVEAKLKTGLDDMKIRARDSDKPRDFRQAIKKTPALSIRLIAELKKASPSRGIIRGAFDPVHIARIYNEKADAISILTEEDFFQGKLEYIALVKKHSSLPVLRKDFIVDEYQIYEARAHGADAILLIASVLERSQAYEYLELAKTLGLAVLFEVHDQKELETALYINAEIIGINNRNLNSMKINLATTGELKKAIPSNKIVVSESGIRTRQDVIALEEAGIDAMLVGSAFMEALDIGAAIDAMRGDA